MLFKNLLTPRPSNCPFLDQPSHSSHETISNSTFIVPKVPLANHLIRVSGCHESTLIYIYKI